jgi:hypothetical protein
MDKYRTPPARPATLYLRACFRSRIRGQRHVMTSPAGSELNPLMLAGVILFAAAFLCLIFYLVGRLGGWGRLAEDYLSENDMPARCFRMRSAMVRWAHYGNCITFGVDHRGLHMASFGPLLGHPRLCIPWQEITVTPKKILWANCVEMRFRRAPEIPVFISARLSDQLNSAAGSSSPRNLQHASVSARAAA